MLPGYQKLLNGENLRWEDLEIPQLSNYTFKKVIFLSFGINFALLEFQAPRNTIFCRGVACFACDNTCTFIPPLAPIFVLGWQAKYDIFTHPLRPHITLCRYLLIEWGEDDDHHVPDDEDDAVLPVHLPTIHMTCSNKENNRGEQSKGWVENTCNFI